MSRPHEHLWAQRYSEAEGNPSDNKWGIRAWCPLNDFSFGRIPLILGIDCLRVDFKWDVQQIIFMRLAGNQVCNKWEKTSAQKDL
jgi:hypothetical protein